MTITSHDFVRYWNAVDAAMLKFYAIDTNDAGIEPERIAAAQQDGDTPEEFALWFGEKYDLRRVPGPKGGQK